MATGMKLISGTVVLVIGTALIWSATKTRAQPSAMTGSGVMSLYASVSGNDGVIRAADGTGDSFIADFARDHDRALFNASDFFYTSDFQRTAWEADHLIYGDDGLALMITRQITKGGLPFTGAQLQTKQRYHYGRYEVVMRPARGSGLVSAFFTFEMPPHDEIDIEFLGDDMRTVHFNSYTKAVAAGFKKVTLPYDADTTDQLYALEWRPDAISWFVGDQHVHTYTSDDGPIPQTPQKAIISLWSSGQALAEWHGPPTFASGTSSLYKCMSYRAFGDVAEQCSDSYRFDLPSIQ